jgi:glycosyltransferase involved in cell wall biosynthesis
LRFSDAERGQKIKLNERSNLSLSIVVTSFSLVRLQDICRLFDSIDLQNRPELEVIFIVEKSAESAEFLRKLAEEKQRRSFNLKVVLNNGTSGVNICRNIGIMSSTGELIGVVDDDVILSKEWVSTALAAFEQNVTVDAVTGPTIPLYDDPPSMSWFPKELYFCLGCTVWDWKDIRKIRNVGGMNCVFKKSVLLRAGMYDPNIGPVNGGTRAGKFWYVGAEEVDLSLRLERNNAGNILYLPKLVVYHRVRRKDITLTHITRRSLHFGLSKGYVAQRFPAREGKYDILRLEKNHFVTMILAFPRNLHRRRLASFKQLVKSTLFVVVSLVAVCIGYISYNLYRFE